MGNAVVRCFSRSLPRKNKSRLSAIAARNRAYDRCADRAVWKGAVGRCRGMSHEESNDPCQDQVAYAIGDDGSSVIALSDGAGSARYSHFGAALAVAVAARVAPRMFDDACCSHEGKERFKMVVLGEINAALDDYAQNGQRLIDDNVYFPDGPDVSFPCEARDLACTLLLVVVKGNQWLAMHIGDGVVGKEVVRAGKASLVVVSAPDNGEFANETYFVNSRCAFQRARLFKGKVEARSYSTTGFVLMSDGPEAALLRKSDCSLAPACSKLLEACRELDREEMEVRLEGTIEDVIRQKTGDDCSIALLARVGAKIRG